MMTINADPKKVHIVGKVNQIKIEAITLHSVNARKAVPLQTNEIR